MCICCKILKFIFGDRYISLEDRVEAIEQYIAEKECEL